MVTMDAAVDQDNERRLASRIQIARDKAVGVKDQWILSGTNRQPGISEGPNLGDGVQFLVPQYVIGQFREPIQVDFRPFAARGGWRNGRFLVVGTEGVQDKQSSYDEGVSNSDHESRDYGQMTQRAMLNMVLRRLAIR